MTRGIVIPAGGVVLLNHAWATIKVCSPLLALPSPDGAVCISAVSARQPAGAVSELSEVLFPASLILWVSGAVRVIMSIAQCDNEHAETVPAGIARHVELHTAG